MAEIIDSIINVSINDAISNVSTSDVNTMAIVGKQGEGKSGTAGSYSTLKAIGDSFGKDSEIYAMASAFFGQSNQPESLVVIPVSGITDLANGIKAASEAGLEFYHICASCDEADISAQLPEIHTDLEDGKMLLHLQTSSKESAKNMVKKLSDMELKRTAVFLHGVKNEFLNVAIVTVRCAKDSAKGTFAHKKVNGITPDAYSKDDYNDLVNAGVNIYCKARSKGRIESRLFMGTTKDKTCFIDNIIKDDWIRFNVQIEIFSLLGEANDGDGVNYEDSGIDSIPTKILQVFSKASDSAHKYIMEGYIVDYKNYDYLKKNNADDVKNRNLPLVKGYYSRMNSVHTARNVQLNVTL